MNTTDYRPIPCSDYSNYELAIMHHSRLHVVWLESGILYNQFVIPIDLITHKGEEFLVFKNDKDETRRIRLDRIRRSSAA